MDLKEIEKLQELLKQQEELLEKEKEKILKKEYHAKVVLGFKLAMESSGIWRAFKRIEGENHVPHIGKDPRNAEEKIRKYIQKKELN